MPAIANTATAAATAMIHLRSPAGWAAGGGGAGFKSGSGRALREIANMFGPE